MVFSTSLLYEMEISRKEKLEIRRHEILELAIIKIKSVFKTVDVKEVYITGSILIPHKFTSHSDIDIAVKGLSATDYFSVISRLEEILLITVEIIELENCRFSDKIISTGLKIIWDAGKIFNPLGVHKQPGRSNYLVLEELMGFRHVFRHAYNYNLTPDKMEFLRKKILEQKSSIDSDIKIFKKFLEEGFSFAQEAGEK